MGIGIRTREVNNGSRMFLEIMIKYLLNENSW